MRAWIAGQARPLSVVVAALLVAVAGGIAYVVLTGTPMKHATVYFPSTVGIYKGSSVRVLGVEVGKVDSVTPQGTAVRVTLTYKASTRIPANAGMAQVPPSIVSDRYLQFVPAYSSGPLLADHATIQEDKTEVPVELDQIFGSINDLDVALGPNGANSKGALSQLVDVGAANLKGNGAQFNATLKGFSAAVNALSDSRDQLFGTITSLQRFTTTLAADDSGVREVNGRLAQVSAQLAGERGDLGAALANLSTALGQVRSFVADNRDTLTQDVGALTSVTSGLASQQQAIKEVLDEAPVALHNLGLSYDPCPGQQGTASCRSGALATRLNNLSNPSALVCQVLGGVLGDFTTAVSEPVVTACSQVLGAGGSSTGSTGTGGGGGGILPSPLGKTAPRPSSSVPPPSIQQLLGGLLGGTGAGSGSGAGSGGPSSGGSNGLGELGKLLLGGAA